jgi:molybdate transport system substrate-binding protein
LTRGAALAGAALALALGGCGDDDSQDGGDGSLTVSAASSLTEAFEGYARDFGGDVRFSFAGSDELAAQIRAGAPVDVFASANTSLPDELHDEGLVEEPAVFTRNQLVLAVPAGSGIDSIGELAGADADIVIGAEGVPAGDYTREVLDRLPKAERRAILAGVRSEEPEVKGIVAKLVAGAADAGFVYASDVAAAGGQLVGIELPVRLRPEVAYGAAVVADGAHPALAEEFVAGLLDGAGERALADAGFLRPGGGP